jgi:transposase
MGKAIEVRSDVTAGELRARARKEPVRRAALRMLAMANVLDGLSRAEAARAAGIERQSLCDAVKRFNAEGWAGLYDRPKGHARPRLDEAELVELKAHILAGPDPERGEPSAWTLPDLCRFIEARFGKTLVPQSMSRVVRGMGLSRQKARPVHPRRDEEAVEAFRKGGSVRP